MKVSSHRPSDAGVSLRDRGWQALEMIGLLGAAGGPGVGPAGLAALACQAVGPLASRSAHAPSASPRSPHETPSAGDPDGVGRCGVGRFRS